MTQIQGGAGALEVRIDEPPAPPRALVVLCHPHPRYGGSMHDGVLDAAIAPLLDAGLVCARFNFRGVGASEGRFDDGEGEREDVCSVARWLRSEQPGLPLALLGYSFGAAMAWAASTAVEPCGLLLIAPPVAHMRFDADRAPSCRVDILIGDQDDFAPAAQIRSFHDALPHPGHLQTVVGGDHFFSGALRSVADAAARIAQAI